MNGKRVLEDLRRAVPGAARRVPTVSEWSVGMHVHHCCLAMIGICKSLNASQLPTPPSAFSLVRSVVLFTGRIPRGRGQAPSSALPKPDLPAAELLALMDESERMLTEASQAHPGQWYKHFVFGVLDRDKTFRFIDIHNRHHWRIIQDIVTA